MTAVWVVMLFVLGGCAISSFVKRDCVEKKGES